MAFLVPFEPTCLSCVVPTVETLTSRSVRHTQAELARVPGGVDLINLEDLNGQVVRNLQDVLAFTPGVSVQEAIRWKLSDCLANLVPIENGWLALFAMDEAGNFGEQKLESTEGSQQTGGVFGADRHGRFG
ncbi:hypothetical protein [Luteimonas salinilitoris]|uniref:Uncharacterized protein n=1 Tax=Luteimonas salinilitoris TaxID=3237697 RepID=A0ABV4HVV8_9GAMM